MTFALPIVYAVAVKHDPRSLPLLHRIEYTVSRMLINPALLVVVAAGIYLASDGHHWSEFFVQWGLGAAIVIGGLVGAVLIPAAKRAEAAAHARPRRGTGAGRGLAAERASTGASERPPRTWSGSRLSACSCC